MNLEISGYNTHMVKTWLKEALYSLEKDSWKMLSSIEESTLWDTV